MNPASMLGIGVAANFSIHPATSLFPEMDMASFEALVTDIKDNGQREPILVQAGQVIDGRHRLRACTRLGIEPQVREVGADEGDPITLVISLNLHRRHLTESQRAMVAARLATRQRGDFHGNQHLVSANLPIPVLSQSEAAEQLKVSERLVRNARVVQSEGIPELVAAVDAGEIAVSTAADLAYLPVDEQRGSLARSPDEIRAIARDVKNRIHEAGVTGSSAVRIFDKVSQEQGLSGFEQIAVVEVIKADTPMLPTPTEARRIATEGTPGLLVLATDGRYHTAPGDPEDTLKCERWLRLREGLEALGTLDFDSDTALTTIPYYQHLNVRHWLDRAVPFLNTFHQKWSQDHA